MTNLCKICHRPIIEHIGFKCPESSESALNDLLCCPFCKSTDVGSVTRLGTTYFDCYECDARVYFTKVGLHISEQLKRFNFRAT